MKLAVEAGENEEVVRESGILRAWLDIKALDFLETGGVRSVSGYDFSDSRILEGDEWLEFHVKYRVEILEGLIPIPGIPMKNSVFIRAWTGYSQDTDFSGCLLYTSCRWPQSGCGGFNALFGLRPTGWSVGAE